MNRFFDLVGVLGAIVALCAVGASAGIITKLVRVGHRRMAHIIMLACSWCLLASVYVYRFWTGAYDQLRTSDRIVLCAVLAAFTLGGVGLWMLWSGPAKSQKSDR